MAKGWIVSGTHGTHGTQVPFAFFASPTNRGTERTDTTPKGGVLRPEFASRDGSAMSKKRRPTLSPWLRQPDARRRPPTTSHNYEPLVLEAGMKVAGQGKAFLTQVTHDDWCDALNRRGFCNCTPTVEMVPYMPKEKLS